MCVFGMCVCFENCVDILVMCVLVLTVFFIFYTVLFYGYVYLYLIFICFLCTSVRTTVTP